MFQGENRPDDDVCQRVDKRPMDIVGGFHRLVGIELQRSCIGGEGEPICCFDKQPAPLFA